MHDVLRGSFHREYAWLCEYKGQQPSKFTPSLTFLFLHLRRKAAFDHSLDFLDFCLDDRSQKAVKSQGDFLLGTVDLFSSLRVRSLQDQPAIITLLGSSGSSVEHHDSGVLEVINQAL